MENNYNQNDVYPIQNQGGSYRQEPPRYDGPIYGQESALEGRYGQQHEVAPSEPVSYAEQLKVTSLHDLQAYKKGSIVKFPDFAEGQPFVARVKRPSMLVLAKQGKIPNSLINTANELFSKGGGMDSDNENMLEEMYGVMETICEAALIEPSYEDIKDIGLTLSDDQLMAIFNYTQVGVKALESFRKK